MTTRIEPDAKALVRAGYDRASRAYRDDAFPLARSGYAHWLRRLRPALAPGARVLDLGCGCGVPAAQMLARDFRVTGVDLSRVQLARARALVPGASFVHADMARVAFAPGAFAAVVAFFSIIHLPLAEQPGLLARIAGWLAPGGRLLAVLGREAWTGVEENWRGVPGVRMYYSHASAHVYRGWLAEAGFAVEEEGVEPPRGNPGYAVFLARRAG